MNPTAAAAVGGLALRESGLIVPAHLAGAPEEPAADGVPQTGEARDADGRRRILISKDSRKRLGRLAGDLGANDVAFVMVCKTFRHVVRAVKDAKSGTDVPVAMAEPIPGACGEVMKREGEDTDDPGFGCKCTRVHFMRF